MSSIAGMFRKSKNALESGGITSVVEEKYRCPKCKSNIVKKEAVAIKMTCPNCGMHFRISARIRLKALCDKNSFSEIQFEVKTNEKDPLNFLGYDEKIRKARITTSEEEAVICGVAKFKGEKTAVFAMEPNFMMGSMGTVVGEKITQLFEYAIKEDLPVVGFTCSGGARMQEGILSLMQMAKVSGAVQRHGKGLDGVGRLYLTVLTDPTTGGVTASFAMLGDIIISEPNATIGFAGQRVIEQTTKKKLPEGFQKAEFLLEHGFIDAIVHRADMRNTISTILKNHKKVDSKKWAKSIDSNIESLHLKLDESFNKVKGGKKFNTLTPYERVEMARSTKRPTAKFYIDELFSDTIKLHGDRKFADDKAIIGGIGTLDNLPVTFIGIERGTTLDERIKCNFGSPMPEGYRKALRLMKQAEKFNRPVICFVDTAGAFCGEEAEERGQGQAIAHNLLEMMGLKIPVITILIGEGGSGGALGLSVANKVYMLENAVYSVISPEGCASILWEDSTKATEAAKSLCICSEDMLRFNVAERVIKEDFDDFSEMCDNISLLLKSDIGQCFLDGDCSENRYQRFRNLGN